MTRQKQVILKILRASMSHPTAEAIYQEARKEILNLSRATVYRNLRLLADQGLIIEHSSSRHPSRYDYNIGKHYHARCVQCGRIDDLPLSFMRGLEEQVSQSISYQILEHRLEVLGICPPCGAKTK
ncbi:MAG: transcriptional repressor [Acidobacteria bacterium]|nr:transcriptional repressor [Acidobacteriota bacterium]